MVEEALTGMSETDREVLALRHFEELTNNEVAEVLGLERKAAKNPVRAGAAARLKIVLQKIPGFFAEGEMDASASAAE